MPPQWEAIIKRPRRSWEMEELTAEAALFTFPLPWRCDVNLNATHTSTLAAFRACGGLFQEIKRASTNSELNPKVWIDTFPMMGKGFHLIDTYWVPNHGKPTWPLVCCVPWWPTNKKSAPHSFQYLNLKKKEKCFCTPLVSITVSVFPG